MGIIIGIAATLITILFNYFAGSAFQTAFGTLGTAFTEIGFAVIALATAVIYVVWKRRDLDRRHIEYGESDYTVESVFPFKIPKLGHVLGGFALMFAGYLLSIMYYNIIMRLFPETYAALNDAILSSAYTGTFASVFCSVAIVPAVCEELLLRGAIQRTFGDLKKPIYTILLTGLMFGLFHIDPIRIPYATMMGIILSYAYYRSGSLLVPILMHFANNAYSVISSWQYRDVSADELMTETSAAFSDPMTATLAGLAASIGFVFITSCAIVIGVSFLEPNLIVTIKKHRKVLLAAGICVLSLGVGMFISIALFGY